MTSKDLHSPASQPKIPREPAAIRKALLADPNTAEIAKNLGLELEEYLQQVVHFAMNPTQEPTLYLVEDEDLKAAGYEPPDAEQMGQFLIEAVKLTEAADKTEWTDPKGKSPVQLGQGLPPPEVPEITDPALKAELEKAMRAKRGGSR